MSNTKIETEIDSLFDRAKDVASNVAIVAMAAATVIGMTELTNRQDLKVQPVYAFSGSNIFQPVQGDNTIRKEEVAHRPISYGITMRSEAISGKR
jgi:hypothetical protein